MGNIVLLFPWDDGNLRGGSDVAEGNDVPVRQRAREGPREKREISAFG